MDTTKRQQHIKNLIINESSFNHISKWYNSISSKTLRAKMINDGIDLAIKFIEDSH